MRCRRYQISSRLLLGAFFFYSAAAGNFSSRTPNVIVLLKGSRVPPRCQADAWLHWCLRRSMTTSLVGSYTTVGNGNVRGPNVALKAPCAKFEAGEDSHELEVLTGL